MRVIVLAMMALLIAPLARAEGERAGAFDYYVMALSWSANWCATTGDARDDPQCDAGRGIDFVLHGLWPQYEDGWPSYCRTVERDPPRSMTAAQADPAEMARPGRRWISGTATPGKLRLKLPGQRRSRLPLTWCGTVRAASRAVRSASAWA